MCLGWEYLSLLTLCFTLPTLPFTLCFILKRNGLAAANVVCLHPKFSTFDLTF